MYVCNYCTVIWSAIYFEFSDQCCQFGVFSAKEGEFDVYWKSQLFAPYLKETPNYYLTFFWSFLQCSIFALFVSISKRNEIKTSSLTANFGKLRSYTGTYCAPYCKTVHFRMSDPRFSGFGLMKTWPHCTDSDRCSRQRRPPL